MDAYLNWVFWRVAGAGFPVSDYPHFVDHNHRTTARPSYLCAMDIEAIATATLEAEGLAMQLSPLSA